MRCFACFFPRQKDSGKNRIKDSNASAANSKTQLGRAVGEGDCARNYHFQELALATMNFTDDNLIGEGGFGRVYRGRLDSGSVVAIKQLNKGGIQGLNEFVTEVLMLSMLRHSNLVKLYGYCIEGHERLLVYEYMPQRSLENQLFVSSSEKPPLDWNTRIKIALGAAEGLTYLHSANPPIIYRDMKAANILLDNDFNPKLSDFGLAKIGPVGVHTHVSTRVMGTYGYCAPDYAVSGKLSMKSDVYSFGVLLLELLTGRKAFDSSRGGSQRNLITWARPFLSDKRRCLLLADPSLRGCFPIRSFCHVAVISSMCLQDKPHVRPIMSDVVAGLNHVASEPYIPESDSSSSSSSSSSPALQTDRARSKRRRGSRLDALKFGN